MLGIIGAMEVEVKELISFSDKTVKKTFKIA